MGLPVMTAMRDRAIEEQVAVRRGLVSCLDLGGWVRSNISSSWPDGRTCCPAGLLQRRACRCGLGRDAVSIEATAVLIGWPVVGWCWVRLVGRRGMVVVFDCWLESLGKGGERRLWPAN